MARSAAISGKMTKTWVSACSSIHSDARVEARAAVDDHLVEARPQDGEHPLQLIDRDAEVGVRVGRRGQDLHARACGVR